MLTALRRSLTVFAASSLAVLALVQPVHAESINEQLGLDFKAAQDISTGKGTTIAIVGSGLDGAVNRLQSRLKASTDLADYGGAGKRVLDTLLASFIIGGTKATPALNVRGLAPDVSFISVRVEPEDQDFTDGSTGWNRWWNDGKSADDFHQGIRYAVDQGADVILVTWRWIRTSTDLNEAVAYAVSKGAVVVVNTVPVSDAKDREVIYPAGLPGVIGVAAIDASGKPVKGSTSRNSGVLVAGTTADQTVVGPKGEEWTVRGASVAAAQVAAAVALVKSRYPDLGPSVVAQAIAGSTRRRPKGGYNVDVGFGVVNPEGALRKAGEFAAHAQAATPGGAVIDTAGYFGGGPGSQKINAIQHETTTLVLWGGLAGVGVVLLGVGAGLLATRRRSS
ncbi:S8 family serine peptidase [Rhizohabitans arisaemae]|uniref:S8 family serine peptidase n=1 Tax=Rhizohabitans arisaemae TaxID=2720610 RepID=UPI0024B198C2|nr:S8 family serine peptidase [Rhizohabitans arisaemae]